MKIGVYIPNKYATSIKIYTEEILNQLEIKGIEIFRFTDNDTLPTAVDLYWDSRCSGGGAPVSKLRGIKKPLVITLHGVGDKFLPSKLAVNTNIKWYNKTRTHLRNKVAWYYFKDKVSAIITVSQYAKEEIVEYFEFENNIIFPIYHGVNKELFYPSEISKANYFLHISSFQPKKNIDRIIEAYSLIPQEDRIPMKLIVPGYKGSRNISNLEIITNKISHQQAAELYREARALVFPSLHESFGMPLVEAMACGCPVITSNITACPEVVGNAGILVNPESVQEINGAMQQLINEEELFNQLRNNALERAKSFSWELSAMQHLEVFKRTMINSK